MENTINNIDGLTELFFFRFAFYLRICNHKEILLKKVTKYRERETESNKEVKHLELKQGEKKFNSCHRVNH